MAAPRSATPMIAMNLRVPTPIYEALNAKAEREGVTQTDIVTRALQKALRADLARGWNQK